MFKRLAIILVFIFAGCGHPAISQDVRIDDVVLHSEGGDHSLRLEIAATPDEWSRGLMHRRSLDGIDGMMFLFSGYRQHSMWMKNTFISLDILFLNKDGMITTIHEGAVPHDLTALPSKGAAKGAIELMAGDVARLGLSVGDMVQHPAFTD